LRDPTFAFSARRYGIFSVSKLKIVFVAFEVNPAENILFVVIELARVRSERPEMLKIFRDVKLACEAKMFVVVIELARVRSERPEMLKIFRDVKLACEAKMFVVVIELARVRLERPEMLKTFRDVKLACEAKMFVVVTEFETTKFAKGCVKVPPLV
jgi:hypothetical protein